MQKLRVILVPLTLLFTAGCATGFDAATQTQQPTGNGRYLEIGELSVQNLVVVAGETNSALLMKIFNESDQADRLIALSVAERPVLSDVAIAPNQILAYGNSSNPAVNFANVAKAGGYVPIRIEFEAAGIYETTVLVVAPTNQYSGLVD